MARGGAHRSERLDGLAAWIEAHPDQDQEPDGALFNHVAEHLAAVRDTASPDGRQGRWGSLFAASSGASFERTRGNLDAVEANLLRLAPASYVRGEMASLLAHVNRFLQKAPRRAPVEQLATKAERSARAAADAARRPARAVAAAERRRPRPGRGARDEVAGLKAPASASASASRPDPSASGNGLQGSPLPGSGATYRRSDV